MRDLLSDIDAFLSETGIGDFRFGIRAVNNGRLMERLRKGKPVLNTTEAKIRQFMQEELARRAPKEDAAA